jgi:hypothetical protein
MGDVGGDGEHRPRAGLNAILLCPAGLKPPEASDKLALDHARDVRPPEMHVVSAYRPRNCDHQMQSKCSVGPEPLVDHGLDQRTARISVDPKILHPDQGVALMTHAARL